MDRLFMTLLVRDEADIIAYNISYHLRHGVDHIIVTDNGSIDGTREILARFEQMGQVTVIDELEHNYQQSIWVTNMNKLARSMGADYIINADADEFFVSESGDLRQEFLERPSEVSFSVPLFNVAVSLSSEEPGEIYTASFPVDSDVLIRRYYTTDVATYGVFAEWPSKVMYRVGDSDVGIGMGNHTTSLGIPQPAAKTKVIHFPFRSFQHFERKIVNGGSSYAKSGLPDSVGYHWRLWYSIYLKDKMRATNLLELEYLNKMVVSAEAYYPLLDSGDCEVFNCMEFLMS